MANCIPASAARSGGSSRVSRWKSRALSARFSARRLFLGTAPHMKTEGPTCLRGWTYVAEDPGESESRRGLFTFFFDDGVTVDVRVVAKSAGYATFEVAAIDRGGLDVRNVIWGPLITDIAGTVGSLVGVVSTSDFALGMFGVNAKTMGGWPDEYLSLGYNREMAVGDDQKRRNGRNPYIFSAAAAMM